METVKGDSKYDLASFNTEELKFFYQKVNTKLSSSLLNGASLEDQQENIKMLNKISEELNRRKVIPDHVHDTKKRMRS